MNNPIDTLPVVIYNRRQQTESTPLTIADAIQALSDQLITPGECRRELIRAGMAYNDARLLALMEWHPISKDIRELDEMDPA